MIQNSSSYDTIYYKPDIGFQGNDTIVVECAKATQITCDTGIYIITVDCSEIYFTELHETTCGDTLIIDMGTPWSPPASIIQEPANGTAAIVFGVKATDGRYLYYISNSDFAGTDTVIVKCATNNCETGIYVIHVSCLDEATESLKTLRMRFFPNPAHDFLTVESEVPIRRINLITLDGKMLKYWEYGNFYLPKSLDLRAIPPGIYGLEFISETYRRFKMGDIPMQILYKN